MFGDPRHEVSRLLLAPSLHQEAIETEGEQVLDLHYTGEHGLEPDLAALAQALPGLRLLQGGVERIQGRALGRLRVAVSGGDLERVRGLADRVERLTLDRHGYQHIVWGESPSVDRVRADRCLS